MSNFADRLVESIDLRSSYIVAGFDPRIESIPEVILKEAAASSLTNEEALYLTLFSFYSLAAEALQDCVAAVKPNLAFFEQFGLSGLRAYSDICAKLRELKLPVIADAKRGDIGTTAEAYSRAFLGKSTFLGKQIATFEADALTVNPYLGFDTLEVYLKDCSAYGKGIFVLVQTSNPGSKDLQAQGSSLSISQRVADWVRTSGKDFIGDCGYSSIGAVVGATYPEDARTLRLRMPDSFFLIPGMGSQGGSAEDAVAGFGISSANAQKRKKGGALINLSRGLLSDFSSLGLSKDQIKNELIQKAREYNRQIELALGSES